MSTRFISDVQDEFERAAAKHPKLNSGHEALAVLWEEFDEVRQEVFKKHPDRENLYKELVQTAAMCYRFANDVLRRG